MLQFIYVAYCAMFKRLKCVWFVYLKYLCVFYVKSKIVSSYVSKKQVCLHSLRVLVRSLFTIDRLPVPTLSLRKYQLKSESWGVFV